MIDNDPAGRAGPVARSIGSEHVRYVVEPEPGISAGRNRALDETADRDLLVFIDDDEQPLDGWLTALLDTWSDTRAAAVMGRVVSKFEGELDPWVAAGEFFRRRRMKTGTEITVAAAGNLLLDLNQVRALGVRFDNNLGLSGGEDTLFSRLLVRRGGRMVWCDESVADDYVPADRVTRQWVRNRAWSHGNTASVIDLYLADGPRPAAARAGDDCRSRRASHRGWLVPVRVRPGHAVVSPPGSRVAHCGTRCRNALGSGRPRLPGICP